MLKLLESIKSAANRPFRRGRRKATVLPLPTRLTQAGTVVVYGAGDKGQLGSGRNDREVVLTGFENIVDVYAGGTHTLFLNSAGQVYSFGCNEEGGLGRDTRAPGSEFTPGVVELPGKAVMICAGKSHSACLLEDGSVYAWGSFGNMAMTIDGIQRSPINILVGKKCVKIASGVEHLAMLTTNGKVFTMGCPQQGQLGRVSSRVARGEVRYGRAVLLQPQEVVVLRCRPFIDLWASEYGTYVKEQDTNQIWAWGLNDYKQLAYNSSDAVFMRARVTEFPDVQMISGGGDHTIALDQGGSMWTIGKYDYTPLGCVVNNQYVRKLTRIHAFGGEQVRHVSCGGDSSLFITKSHNLYGWGANQYNQLGLFTNDETFLPVQIVSETFPENSIIKVSTSGWHSVFLVRPQTELPKKKAKNKVTYDDSGEPANKLKKVGN